MLGHVAELYRFRALIATLVLRDLRARYRGSFFGFLWSFLNPLLLMLVYALVFSVYLRVPMENYAVFLFTGLLPWLWFSASLGHAAAVIVGSGGLVKRIMFPAEILPLVAVLSNLVNLLLSLPLLFVFLWTRWTLPRFRYDQLMALGWKGVLPLAMLQVVAASVQVALGWVAYVVVMLLLIGGFVAFLRTPRTAPEGATGASLPAGIGQP